MRTILLLTMVLAAACGGGDGDVDGGGFDGGPPPDAGPPLPPARGWPTENEYSWNGRWTPTEFPLDGLLDDEYFDGHMGRDGMATPVLPPGAWDYEDPNDDLANWRNFSMSIGALEMLRDAADNHYGWRILPTDFDYSGAGAFFEGSTGTDIVDLGPGGAIHSFGEGDLRDGPDVLVFDRSWSIHFRTGSTQGGFLRDDDLVIAGCGNNTDGAFDIMTTTVHTGPGRDWVFIRDLSRAGVDLGNGNGGRTDTVDPADLDDLVVLRGNTHDFRVSGGNGNDVAVWYVDDNVQTEMWLGPNFFGGGGSGDALWGDPGTDRLVLAVPDDTAVVATTPTPPGSLLVRATDGGLILDDPTQDDVYARYCVECGTGPGGRKTLILEYVSADDTIQTGYFYLTSFEEVQVGIGDAARVYRIDDVEGRLEEDTALEVLDPPSPPPAYCE